MSKKDIQIVTTPVGQVINQSLFEKDAYTDAKGREGIPAYKVELAMEDNDELADLEEAIYGAAIAQWGDKAEDDLAEGKIRSPLLVGDDLAAAREAKGKKGDAYKGKIVIRASTIYNKHGEDGPGGVPVFDEDVAEIDFASRDKIYNGVEGEAAITISCYEIRGERGVKLYLSAFRRTGDGERLVGERDFTKVFQPVSTGAATSPRRRRAG